MKTFTAKPETVKRDWYVVDAAGKAARRSIQTEGVTAAGVVVISGLQPGEAIITRGATMVRDGDTVKFRKE